MSTARALEGIRVVELTVWFQGPVTGQHLADFGAEVIKVERPDGGDPGRGVQKLKSHPTGDWNQYFLVINRNKKSIVLDLKSEAGREIMFRLIEESDVFLSNLSPARLAAWKLDYEHLRTLNPRLIYAMNTGYGPFGPVDRPSFDMTVQALTGMMARRGEPLEPPVYIGMGAGDAFGGLLAALGINIALHHRRKTGRGQMLDASLYGAQLFLDAPALQAFLATGAEHLARQRSRSDAPNPLHNTYPSRDGWLVLCVEAGQDAWSRLCTLLDPADLAADERFASADRRLENRAALVAALDAIFRQRDSATWMERCRAANIAASPVHNYRNLAKDPQAWANDYLMETYCEQVQRDVPIRGLPIGLSKTPGTVRALGPELGQDTERILTELLGYSWDDVGRFKKAGAIP